MPKDSTKCVLKVLPTSKIFAITGRGTFDSLEDMFKAIESAEVSRLRYEADSWGTSKISKLEVSRTSVDRNLAITVTIGHFASERQIEGNLLNIKVISPVEAKVDKINEVVSEVVVPEVLSPPVSQPEVVEASVVAQEKLSTPDSGISYQGFEKTSGQDVLSELNGELKPGQLALDRVKLKEQMRLNPSDFVSFIVDSEGFNGNEDGMGEGLLVIDRTVYESMLLKNGRGAITYQALRDAQRHPILPLEGESPFSGSKPEDDTFFQRDHDQRLSIAVDKLGLTPEQADKFYREGQRKLRAARARAKDGPVRVSIREVSRGYFANKTRSIGEFFDQYPESKIGKVKTGTNIRSLSVIDKNGEALPIRPKEKVVWSPEVVLEIFDRRTDPEISEGLSNTFLKNRKSDKLSFDGKNFYFGSKLVSDDRELFDLLSGETKVSLYHFDKVPPSSVVKFVHPTRGVITANPIAFYDTFTEVDGDFWTHEGKPVPYRANQVVYLTLDPESDTGQSESPAHLPSFPGDSLAVFFNTITPDQYDAISDPDLDSMWKRMFPRLFSEDFRRSFYFERWRAGVKYSPRGTTKFGKSFVRSEGEYLQHMQRLGYSVQEAKMLLGDMYMLGLKSDMDAPQRVALKKKSANLVILKMENARLFGGDTETLGERVWSDAVDWEANLPRMTDGPSMSKQLGSDIPKAYPVLRGYASTQGRTMSADTYRVWMIATDRWSESMESRYKSALSGAKFSDNPISLAMSHPEFGDLDIRVLFPIDQNNYPEEFSAFSKGADITGLSDVNMLDLTIKSDNQQSPILSVLNTLDPVVSGVRGVDLDGYLFNYAKSKIGSAAAKALLSTYLVSTADIDILAKHLGEGKLLADISSSFVMGDASLKLISDGKKNLTLRQGRFDNPGGLMRIDGVFYDFENMGTLSVQDAMSALNISLNQLLSGLTGDPNADMSSITDTDMKKYLEGVGTRTLYSITKLGQNWEPAETIRISCNL